MTQTDKALYQTIAAIKCLYFIWDPVIGGSTALYLQHFPFREPHDLDLFFVCDRSDFLQWVDENDIGEPEGLPMKVDWEFWPEIETHPITLKFYDLEVKVQPVAEIVRFKREYQKYGNPNKRQKHVDDLELIKHSFGF